MKFSVIIPCYNVEKYIENTVQIVLNQTYKDFEVILIDDGSKDSTLAILNNLKETDDRIKVFTQPNKGVSYTRNRGIDIAKGEYIYFLDADDEIKNTLFEEADKALIKKSIGVFSFGYKVIKDTKERMYIANKENLKGPFNSSIRIELVEDLKTMPVKKAPLFAVLITPIDNNGLIDAGFVFEKNTQDYLSSQRLESFYSSDWFQTVG